MPEEARGSSDRNNEYDGAGRKQQAEEAQHQAHRLNPPAHSLASAGARLVPSDMRLAPLQAHIFALPRPPKSRRFMLKLRLKNPSIRRAACKPGAEIGIHSLHHRIAGSLAPFGRNERLDIGLVCDESQLDQDRWDIRGLE